MNAALVTIVLYSEGGSYLVVERFAREEHSRARCSHHATLVTAIATVPDEVKPGRSYDAGSPQDIVLRAMHAGHAAKVPSRPCEQCLNGTAHDIRTSKQLVRKEGEDVWPYLPRKCDSETMCRGLEYDIEGERVAWWRGAYRELSWHGASGSPKFGSPLRKCPSCAMALPMEQGAP
jgi:hypothetical protein